MIKLCRVLIVGIALVAIFGIAGAVGVLSENIHNDLMLSIGSFLGSFGVLITLFWHIWDTIF